MNIIRINGKLNKKMEYKKIKRNKRSKRNVMRKYFMLFAILILLLGLISIVISFPFFMTFGITTGLNEDTFPVFYINFSEFVNVSDMPPDPFDDVLTYSILEINSSFYPSNSSYSFYNWFNLESDTGILTINSTFDNHTGEYNLSVFVINRQSAGQSVPFYFIINATNDAPNFTNVKSEYNLTQDQEFIDYLNASDEEEHYPLFINVSFLNNCTHAFWSDRTDCSIFNLINFSDTSSLINFTPLRNDVGVYYGNITAFDFGENYICSSGYCDFDYQQNQTTNYNPVVVFNVFSLLSINASDCQNAIFQENEISTCQINISTRGNEDLINLTSLAILRNYDGIVSNLSWFYADNYTNSSNFFKTIYINLIPGKTEIGNWTINFSIFDFTYNERVVEPIFIYVNRTLNDVPDIVDISNFVTSITLFTTINITVFDGDLLIPDKNTGLGGFNETINFTVVIYNQSDLSQELSIPGFDVEILNMPVSGTNRTEARIQFTPDVSEVGNYTINITVRDIDNSTDLTIFNLTVLQNLPPQWNETLQTVFVIIEDDNIFLNLSLNVTDPEGDNITFSFASDTSFPSFSINTTTGVVDFTPTDADVGQHLVNISANDEFLSNITIFNFTIINLNDIVVIEKPIQQIDVINASVDGNSNIIINEDNITTIIIWIQDEDFIIPGPQKSFYDESLILNLTIEGINPNLFVLTRNFAFPIPGSNRSQFGTTFTPVKADVGIYNITINVSDNSGNLDSLVFNLTVFVLEHDPVLMNLTNQTSAVNRSFYYRINSSDIEDGSSTEPRNNNFTYTYLFLNGTDFINNDDNIFNTTTGEINITFNLSQGGFYRLEITVNDTTGRNDTNDFYLRVYDQPVINSPLESIEFNFAENSTNNIIFDLNHSVGDNLTYLIYITYKNGIETLRLNVSDYGNGSNLNWEFKPNFTDEINMGNLTLIAYTSNLELVNRTDINATRIWNITINQTNFLLNFIGNIGGVDSTIVGTSPFYLSLSDYFKDADAEDVLHNQSITFSFTRHSSTLGAITVVITDWIDRVTPVMNFAASTESSATYSVTAFEHNETNFSQVLSSISSNVFRVNLSIIVLASRGNVDSSGSGGSSSSRKVPKAYKIIAPASISAVKNKEINIEFKLVNEGNKNFNDINLTNLVIKGLGKKIRSSIDKPFFKTLKPGQTEDFILTLFFEDEVPVGKYDIIVNATSKSPRYSDWAVIQIDLKEIDISELKEYLIFAEGLINDNFECIEITELTNEAFKNYDIGKYSQARIKAEEAIVSCKANMSRFTIRDKIKSSFRIPIYVIIIIILFSIITLIYYFIKKFLIKRGNKSFKEFKKIDI